MALSLERVDTLKKLAKFLKLDLNNIDTYNVALTHKSFVRENKHLAIEHNERLEFLGDAVLKLVVSDYLYKLFPDQPEGFLTKLRAAIVSDANLAEVALYQNIGQFLQLSKNERGNGGVARKSILANSLEALFGACYVDQGYEKAKRVILMLLQHSVDQIVSNGNNQSDFKSLLQEKVQSQNWKLPEYRVIQEIGPEHEKVFEVQVKIGKGLKKFKSIGQGKTKKEAEQQAAMLVLQLFDDQNQGRA